MLLKNTTAVQNATGVEKNMAASPQVAAKTTHYAMGTVMSHKAFGSKAEESLVAVRSEVARIERLLSRFLPESDICRINRSAGIQSEKVHHDTFELLTKAAAYSHSYQRCFDVTIEPLVNLWHLAKETRSQPDENSIHQALALIDYQDLILDPWEMTAGLRNMGQGIDLGGVGKGFAGDKVLEVYQKFNLTSAYSNLGGNVVTLGTKPDGAPWQIGIQHPRQEDGIIGVVSVVNQSVVTSGDYQRYYIDKQGKRCHHILDPRTGYPSESELISVSIIADKALSADALSTILFIAGMEKGLAYLRDFPQTEAILVDYNLQIYVTRGLEHRFQADQGIEVTIVD